MFKNIFNSNENVSVRKYTFGGLAAESAKYFPTIYVNQDCKLTL